jgi:lipid II:glycine glycyltransferase (peptidoglycan interpeptide bridge formation enzyme)
MNKKSSPSDSAYQSNQYRIEVSCQKEDPEWDAFVINCPDPHHEQTSLWGDLQRFGGWTPLRLICRKDSEIAGGVQILEQPFKRFGTIGYINRGPLLAVDEPLIRQTLIDAIKNIGKTRRMIYLAIILPYKGQSFESDLLTAGFCICPERLPPTTSMKSTIVLNLTPDINEILMKMRKKTRQHIRNAEKGGLTFRVGSESDVNTFKQLLFVLCQKRGVKPNIPPGDFLPELWKAYAPKGYLRLFLTEFAGEAVGALMLFTMGDWIRAWRMGWSGRYDEVYPNDFIFWESIKWAKKNGYRFFDFVGFDTKYAKALIDNKPIPQDEICKMSFFKQGFGGEVLPLHPHYCLFFNPLLRFMCKAGGTYLLNSPILKNFFAYSRKFRNWQ